MQDKFIGMRIICPPDPLNSRIFVDASTGWGIGLILDGKWLAWQFKDGWKSEGCEIGWAEMMAVELAIWTLITGRFIKCHVIVCSDNKGVVGTLGAGRSQGTQQHMILHEIVKLIQDHNLWIPTSGNLADSPLRGVFPGKDSLHAFPPKLPFHLTKFVYKSVGYHDPRL